MPLASTMKSQAHKGFAGAAGSAAPIRSAGWSSRKDGTPTARTLLVHDQMLGERLYLYSLARFLVVVGVVAGSLFATYIVGVEELDLERLMGVALALFVYNTAVFFMVRPYRDHERLAAGKYVLTSIVHGTILLDFFFLTIALWIVGGARSPFLAFYIFHVIIASVLLSRAAAFAHTATGYLFLACLVVGEWAGLIPLYSPEGAVSGAGQPLDGRYVLTVLCVYGLLFALSAISLTSLVQMLRVGEAKLIAAKQESDRLSAMRRDFLQMVLHDVKSPAVAISQHLYNLEAKLSGRLPEQEAHCLERCQIRMQGMLDFLRDLQMLALLESDSIHKQAQPVDLAALLQSVVAENQDLAQLREQTLTLEPLPLLPAVHGIDRLLREAVFNLISNAAKYTPRGGRIAVRAKVDSGRVRIEIEDNGVGISQDEQAHLFEEFSSIRHKKESETDLVASSGLGLSLVRRIAEVHGGTVGVRSERNQGSVFWIELPVATR